jgi:GH24 family phage-related lysozyme (muramidase)
VSEPALRQQFGWTANSGMTSRYVHLSGKDVDREILKANGIAVPDEPRENDALKPVNCPLCATANDATMSYCSKCGASLLKGVKTLADELLERTLAGYGDTLVKLATKENPDERVVLTRDEIRSEIKEILKQMRDSSD